MATVIGLFTYANNLIFTVRFYKGRIKEAKILSIETTTIYYRRNGAILTTFIPGTLRTF